MKKLIYLLSILLFALACSSDDNNASTPDPEVEETEETEEVEVVDPNDLDGDGVTNQQEVIDSTSPYDGCDFNLLSQFYPSTSNLWRNSDCDGDGVVNADERDPDGNGYPGPDQTSLFSGCDFVIERQTVEPSEDWKILDCDHDGFSNAQELLDSTNTRDWCDFVLTNQDVEPSDGWNEYDCDNDGRDNSTEIEENTNPLDPNDFAGMGDTLTKIKRGNTTYNFTTIAGVTLFDNITNSSGSLFYNFEYNSNNQLITVIINGNNTYTYTYNASGQITAITKLIDSATQTTTFEYIDNVINAYNELDELTTVYTLNADGRVNNYRVIESVYYYTIHEFSYNANGNLWKVRSPNFVPNGFGGFEEHYDVAVLAYGYSSVTLNPTYEASNAVYMNIILNPAIRIPNILDYENLSDMYLTGKSDYYGDQGGINNSYTTTNQSNNNPVTGSFQNYYDYQTFDYYYE